MVLVNYIGLLWRCVIGHVQRILLGAIFNFRIEGFSIIYALIPEGFLSMQTSNNNFERLDRFAEKKSIHENAHWFKHELPWLLYSTASKDNLRTCTHSSLV